MESQKYSALYLGHTVVSSGYSKHLIPWVVKEVQKQARSDQVTLQLLHGSLVVASSSGSVVASHPVLSLSHFSQTVADPRCFLYFVKGSHGSHSMYLYQLRDKDMVAELFAAIREHSRRTQQIQRSQSDASAISMSQLRRACAAAGGVGAAPPPAAGLNPQTASYFEVQYVCKIKTSHRKGPPSFIDDALQQFHEFKRRTAGQQGALSHRATPDDAEYLQGDHSLRSGSTDSVNSVGSQGAPPAAAPPAAPAELAEEAAEAGRRPAETVSEPTTPIAVPKIVNIPPTPQSTPCERHLSTVAESASEADGAGPSTAAGLPRSASADGEGVGAEPAGGFRSRAMSGDTARMVRRTSLQHEETMRSRASSVGSSLARRRLSSMDHNYTMLFQVGKLELQLISPDNKAVKLHKFFKDISQITQGQKNSDHFGFICRETPSAVSSSSSSSETPPEPARSGPAPAAGAAAPPAGQKSSYVGYIFRCQSDKISEDVINTLTQAFRSAYDVIRQNKRQNQQQCDYCPAGWFNKLCAELDGLTPEAMQTVILRALECLPSEERRELLLKVGGAEAVDAAEQNELLMSLLRFLCDEKQRKHAHVPAGQQPAGSYDSYNLTFDLSSGLNKAKRSLTSRLEQVWKYNRGREEARENSQSEQLVMHQNSAGTTPEGSPCPTPTKAEFRYEYPSDSPVTSRPRSSTIAGSSGEGYRREYRTRNLNQSARADSPMVAIFKRMGTGPRPLDAGRPGGGGSPAPGGASWRQAIFHRIRTPGEKSPLVARAGPETAGSRPRRSAEELRQLWKKAIHQQVLLNKMERENARITERVQSGERVMYAEMPACAADVKTSWRHLIDGWRAGERVHADDLQELVFRGVPIRARADVWQLLVHHHRQHHAPPAVDYVDNFDAPYLQLIKQLTSFQREILTDLGRTFPHHPYFRSPFGSGQLELFNVLKAVSLLDPELGYCQGLGFIAGILLLHMPEQESYEMLKHMLFALELRKQFMPDMSPLQIQMYQFSRLVHDHHSELYDHLERFEVSPMLYATPWFLTLFSSQYPIGFAARVFDLILLIGLEAVFKVSLALLDVHQEHLKKLQGMEDIMEYIKTEMPQLGEAQAQQVFKKAGELDIGRQLLSYEVEYHVLQEEVLASPSHADSDMNKLGAMNQNLKRQVMDLLQQLQTANDQVKSLTEQNKVLEVRAAQLEAQRSDLVTFVRYLSLHTPDRLEIPQPFRRYLDEPAAPAGPVARDPLNCAVFEGGPPRPRRDRLTARSSSVDCD